VHDYVTRHVESCDLCQKNVSKGIVAKVPMGKLPLVKTPLKHCVDTIGPISPPSSGGGGGGQRNRLGLPLVLRVNFLQLL